MDTLADPSVKGDTGKQSLLTQVCARSLAVGKLDGVDGSRPYCTADGVGAVLAVFWSGPGYAGHDHPGGQREPDRTGPPRSCPATAGSRSSWPSSARTTRAARSCRCAATPRRTRRCRPTRSPPPAPGWTRRSARPTPRIQVARVARAAASRVAQVQALVAKYSKGRDLGFLGEPRVNVLGSTSRWTSCYPERRLGSGGRTRDGGSGRRRRWRSAASLRVYLGAAPGVGKTFRMLDEGNRRLERGTDVVVAFVETHGREHTAERIGALPVMPRRHDRATAARSSRRWTSRRCWPAGPRWRWSTSSRTPTSRALGYAKRWQAVESCWTPAST